MTQPLFSVECATEGTSASFHRWHVERFSAAGAVKILPTEVSNMIRHDQVQAATPRLCVEVCAGMGGASLGFAQAGFVTTVMLDRSSLACDSLRRNGCSAVCSRSRSTPAHL